MESSGESGAMVRSIARSSSLIPSALSSVFCKSNPIADIRVKKIATDRLIERVPEEWPLKPTEQHKVAEIVKDDPERWIIQFAMGAGLRQGEQWNLSLDDVHVADDLPERPWVNVKFGSKGRAPKNGKPRKVPLFGTGL